MPFYRKEETYPSVEAALQNETADQLKKYAALFDQKPIPIRKQELVDFILNKISGDGLLKIWNKLDETQQTAVAEVTHSKEPFFYPSRFVAKYGKMPIFEISKDRKSGYNVYPSWLALFMYKGVMPDDLKVRLKEFVPPPVPTQINVTEELPATIEMQDHEYDPDKDRFVRLIIDTPLQVRETERAAQQDLLTLLRLADAGKISISEKTFRPTEAAMKVIASVLSGGDFYDSSIDEEKDKYEQKIGPIKPFAFPLLLQSARLAELSSKKLALTKAGRKALTSPLYETLRGIWKSWLKTKLIDEFNRVDVIKGQYSKGRVMTAVEGRRAVINEALKNCPIGVWIKLDDFFRFVIASDYDFNVSHDPWELYLCEKQYGSLGQPDNWLILEGRYVLCLLFEYAATLGMIDVAYVEPDRARDDFSDLWGADDLSFLSRYDGLLFFRLTPLGAYCLNLTDTYTPPEVEVRASLTVLPSLKVVTSGAQLAPDEELLLQTYANKLSDNEWHLDLAKTMEAVESGNRPTELREFLQKRDEQPLPETVERFVKDAEDKKRRLQNKGEAFVVDCGSQELAEMLANNDKLKRICLRAGPQCLVVYTNNETQFRKTLYQLGYYWPR